MDRILTFVAAHPLGAIALAILVIVAFFSAVFLVADRLAVAAERDDDERRALELRRRYQARIEPVTRGRR